MAEVGKDKDIKVKDNPEIVAVGDNKIGYVFRAPGQSFHLSGLFEERPTDAEEGTIIDVYLRTADGNILGLNYLGQLVDLNEAKRNGKIKARSVNVEDLKRTRVFVGEKFPFGFGIITDEIVEIVAVNSKPRSSKEIYSKTGGKKNSIVEEFQSGFRQPSSGI